MANTMNELPVKIVTTILLLSYTWLSYTSVGNVIEKANLAQLFGYLAMPMRNSLSFLL